MNAKLGRQTTAALLLLAILLGGTPARLFASAKSLDNTKSRPFNNGSEESKPLEEEIRTEAEGKSDGVHESSAMMEVADACHARLATYLLAELNYLLDNPSLVLEVCRAPPAGAN